MWNARSIYDTIRELDKERRGNKGEVQEMLIEKYMKPQPFRKLGPWGEEEIEGTTMGYLCNEREACLRVGEKWKAVPDTLIEKYEKEEEERCKEEGFQLREANKSDRIRVKNIRTGLSFEFSAMANSARFLGATRANMSYGIRDEVARVYRVGEKEFVFEYDGVERPMERSSSQRMMNGFAEVVSSTGRRSRRFDSYLSVARQLGLLVGHVIEEEKRWKNNQFAKRYVCGKYEYTIEFNGEERDIDNSCGIHCHWKGIYDEDEDWGKIRRINVTYGNPQKRT